MKEFLEKFRYRPAFAGCLGVEREFFLVDPRTGMPVPRSPEFLSRVRNPQWTYELSACQVEHRTAPRGTLVELRHDLGSGTSAGRRTARSMGCGLSAISVAPADMPLDVYPTDTRYRKISASLPEETLRAACRVAGTHIHFGVRDIDEAIEVHNRLAARLDDLIEAGDKSDGERIDIYKVMAPLWMPALYDSPEHLFETAREQGYADNPRNCWHLVRVSIHGTVEVRVFGASDDTDEVLEWVYLVREIARG